MLVWAMGISPTERRQSRCGIIQFFGGVNETIFTGEEKKSLTIKYGVRNLSLKCTFIAGSPLNNLLF